MEFFLLAGHEHFWALELFDEGFGDFVQLARGGDVGHVTANRLVVVAFVEHPCVAFSGDDLAGFVVDHISLRFLLYRRRNAVNAMSIPREYSILTFKVSDYA